MPAENFISSQFQFYANSRYTWIHATLRCVEARRDETKRDKRGGRYAYVSPLDLAWEKNFRDTKMRDVTVKNKAAEGNTTDAA